MGELIFKRCKKAEKLPGTNTLYKCINERCCVHQVGFKDIKLCKDEPIKREARIKEGENDI